MKTIIPFTGMSQYENTIEGRKQGSACGPVTVASIMKFHREKEYAVNDLYASLGTTAIGLFSWRLIRKLRKLTGSRFEIKKIRSIDQVKTELLAGRPVAMKFDRYFSFRWFSKPMFRYHWVPLIGFEEKQDDVILFFHDNGKRSRPSKLRTASYRKHQQVLSFVKIVPVSQ
ncbi:C39 family peptidase [Planococcus salinus]|uniref:Peptidase C39-like domain-containing protein n=1 Tax=Planococcus salinus TaxID=1848460 RepID=A0A3M8P7Z5_9BACL|nr:C39 family peptidase [Planococcus salinus]RNF39324.1 hypothetical protein EEX84_09560 [Planococcus salinus]